jgi:uncharacterized integral membrane protein
MTDAGPTPSAQSTSSTQPSSTDTSTDTSTGTSTDTGATLPPSQAGPVEPTTSRPASTGRPREGLGHTRTSGIWASVVVLVVLLVLLAVFVLQNVQQVQVSYFGWGGRAPLASALLIAAASGALIAVIAGTLRILQLRRRVRRAQKR